MKFTFFLLVLLLGVLLSMVVMAAGQEPITVAVTADKAEYSSGEMATFTVAVSAVNSVSFYDTKIVVTGNDKAGVLSFIEGSGGNGGLYKSLEQNDVDFNVRSEKGLFYQWVFNKVGNDLISVQMPKAIGSFKAKVGDVTGVQMVMVDVNLAKSKIAMYDGNLNEVLYPLKSVPVTITVKPGSGGSVQGLPSGNSSTAGSSSGSSSSSGSGGGCVPEWSCKNWGVCDSTGKQTRSCVDVGKQCLQKSVKTETQSCVCQESWSCSLWSSCVNGMNTRICVDDRKCGTIAIKPKESKGCSEVVAEMPVKQTSQPPIQGESGEEVSAPAVMQKPSTSIFDTYKFWIVGGLFVVLLIITIVFMIYHHILGRGRGGAGELEG
jgi:hypothetical protein